MNFTFDLWPNLISSSLSLNECLCQILKKKRTKTPPKNPESSGLQSSYDSVMLCTTQLGNGGMSAGTWAMLPWLRASREWDFCTGSKTELSGSTNVCQVRAVMSEFGRGALEMKEQLFFLFLISSYIFYDFIWVFNDRYWYLWHIGIFEQRLCNFQSSF